MSKYHQRGQKEWRVPWSSKYDLEMRSRKEGEREKRSGEKEGILRISSANQITGLRPDLRKLCLIPR